MENEPAKLLTGNYPGRLLLLPLVSLLLISGLGMESRADAVAGPYLVVIGAPATGKTKNSKYISEKYGIPSIDALKVLQDEIARAANVSSSPGSRKPGSRKSTAWNERQKSMKAALKKFQNGELVSDDVMNALVLARLLEADCKNGFVLDGYPGSVEQAIYLDGLLMQFGVESPQIILLEMSDEQILEKLAKRGRPHDKGGFAEERLEQFRNNIEPILDYYEGEDLHIIDVSQDKMKVRTEIDKIVGR